MQRTPIVIMRDRAYDLADTGEFKSWSKVRLALLKEGGDTFLIRLLNGDNYFKFRLRQRTNAAWKKLNA